MAYISTVGNADLKPPYSTMEEIYEYNFETFKFMKENPKYIKGFAE